VQGTANGLQKRWGLALAMAGDAYVAGSSGEAFVASRSGSGWAIDQHFSGNPFQQSYGFGVGFDGQTIVVGAYGDSAATDTGVAYVYMRQGNAFVPGPVLTASDGQPGDRFGTAVAVDGARIVVGAPGVGQQVGAAYVFEDVGGTWTEVAKLTEATPVAGRYFGGAVELGPDRIFAGNRRHLTSGFYRVTTSGPGGATVFTQFGGNWIPETTFVPPAFAATSAFGSALSLDDDVLAIGAPYEPDGAVYVYRRTGVTWTLEQQLVGPVGFGQLAFGHDVALDDDRLAVGNPVEGPSEVEVYEHDGTAWNPNVHFASPIAGFMFGSSVALCGSHLVIGYPNAFHVGIFDENGATHPVTLVPLPATYCTAKTSADGCLGQMAVSSPPQVSMPAGLTVTATSTNASKPGILFYGYGATAAPLLGGTLCVQPPLRRTPPVLSTGDGSPCSGTHTFDLGAWLQGGSDPLLVPGSTAYAQFWYRDPGDAFGVGLADAVSFGIWP